LRGSHVPRVDLIFHREGDAVERAERVTGEELGLGAPGGVERRVPADRDERAETSVEAIDALEVCLNELDRRHLLLADEAG
jgi:hypothetical protein